MSPRLSDALGIEFGCLHANMLTCPIRYHPGWTSGWNAFRSLLELCCPSPSPSSEVFTGARRRAEAESFSPLAQALPEPAAGMVSLRRLGWRRVAAAKQFATASGLKLDIVPGAEDVDPIKFVISKSADFGVVGLGEKQNRKPV